LSNQQFISQ